MEQRENWLERYTSEEYCGETIDEAVYAYIKTIDDDTSSCICDTPTLFKAVFCQVPVTITSDYMITLGSRGGFGGMDFKACDLRNIGFQGSQMITTNFSNSVLCGCDFTNVVLAGSDFTNADIHYASLINASLLHCDMTGADLRGTELPDGFVSTDQAEQVKHLKSLNIFGLRI